MRFKKLKLSIILLFGFGLITNAQETINASGGAVSDVGGSVSYSIGQVFHTSEVGTSGSVSNGVQQPFEISVVTQIEEGKNIQLLCETYPNPTTDLLNLTVENQQTKDLNYLLLDMNGKVLEKNKIESNKVSISMKNLSNSIYFLKVTSLEQEIKTFKIIKK